MTLPENLPGDTQIEKGELPRWKIREDASRLVLPETEGKDFLGQIAGCFEDPFQRLMKDVSAQITGEIVFWLYGKNVECELTLGNIDKYRPYNRLSVFFSYREKHPALWTDQAGVRLIFEEELGPYKRGPSLCIAWDFEDFRMFVSREVEHNRALSTPSYLTIRIPIDYSDSPNIMPGLKATGGQMEIGYPFVSRKDAPEIIVPACFFPKTHLLPVIRQDMAERGTIPPKKGKI